MLRALVLAFCLAPLAVSAQPGDACSGSAMPCGQRMHSGQNMMNMTHGHTAGAGAPTEAGQGAFAAIQEIVGILIADPKTDWSKVNIDALRQHLVDMNNVTIGAGVKAIPTDDGMRFEATGDETVRASIRRMVTAHAAAMNGMDGWTFEAAEIDGGAALTVHAPVSDRNKLRGLGFFGVLTLGMHHQMHHLMIARGGSPHG